MTSGRTTVVDWSVVMSPSRPWTVTRGRAAAAAIFDVLSLFLSSLTVSRLFGDFQGFSQLRSLITNILLGFHLGLVTD